MAEQWGEARMRKYGDQGAVVSKSVGKLIKVFASRFRWMQICINKAIAK